MHQWKAPSDTRCQQAWPNWWSRHRARDATPLFMHISLSLWSSTILACILHSGVPTPVAHTYGKKRAKYAHCRVAGRPKQQKKPAGFLASGTFCDTLSGRRCSASQSVRPFPCRPLPSACTATQSWCHRTVLESGSKFDNQRPYAQLLYTSDPLQTPTLDDRPVSRTAQGQAFRHLDVYMHPHAIAAAQLCHWTCVHLTANT